MGGTSAGDKLLRAMHVSDSLSFSPTEYVDVAVGEDITMFVAGVTLDDRRSAVSFQRAVQVVV